MIDRHLFFNGHDIDLCQNEADVLGELKKALNSYYPENIAVLNSYTEIDDRTCEFEITRTFKNSRGCELRGFVNQEDMSMLSGLPAEYFDPMNGVCICGPLTPWYDNMYHCPDEAFADFWKELNKAKYGETFDKAKVTSMSNCLRVKVQFPKR